MLISSGACEMFNHGDKEGAEEASETEDASVQSYPQCSHVHRHFGIEELLHPDDGEDVGDSQENVLRKQPEYAHGNCF